MFGPGTSTGPTEKGLEIGGLVSFTIDASHVDSMGRVLKQHSDGPVSHKWKRLSLLPETTIAKSGSSQRLQHSRCTKRKGFLDSERVATKQVKSGVAVVRHGSKPLQSAEAVE